MKLHTTYFGPIQWYQSLYRSECVIDEEERWQKQTTRNHCLIATANGIQKLTVPIVHGGERRVESPLDSRLLPPSHPGGAGGGFTKSIRISNHGKWRREHWNALCSAYGESPFFDYYADDIRPFFEEEWEYLFDFNLAIIHKMCQLIEGREDSPTHLPSHSGGEMGGFSPRPSTLDSRLSTLTYYQVYQHKHGFIPNLSILDLLCNMGNEAILYL